MPDPPGPCVHPDVGAYALGLLEADERTAYERHLIGCAHCLRTLEGLAPLVELLGQVDAASLLAEADAGADPGGERERVRRPPVHPPGAARVLFPRQRQPVHDRVRRPHLRAWDELDDRFRAPERVRVPDGKPERRAGKGGNDVVRRLVLAAAVLTVVMMVSLVTIAARSSVTDPTTVAEPPPKAPPVAAATTTPAPPPTAAPASTPPAPPSPRVTPKPTGPRVARTKEETAPAPEKRRPDAVKVGPGADAEGDRLTGRDPATGASAEVRLSRTAAGLDVSLTVTKVPGPRECVLRVVTTGGARQTALRWRIPAGEESFTGLGGTTVERAEIDRFELVDGDGAVLVTISSR